MEVKKFTCGLCKGRKMSFVSTRKGLRKHLREGHFIKRNITNTSGERKIKQSWWIAEEIKE